MINSSRDLTQRQGEQLVTELLACPPLWITTDGISAFYIVTSLQMALRDPALTQEVRSNVEAFARGLQAGIGPVGSLVGEVLDYGWDLTLDVHKDGCPG